MATRLALIALACLSACADRVAFVLAPDAGLDSCGLQKNDAPVAFCERFVQPSPIVGRSGPLEGTPWSVARLSGRVNPSQGPVDGWSPSTLSSCTGSEPAQPDGADLVICAGQLRESSNDNGGPTTLALSLNQPFDFANRTGSIGFDVTNDTSGLHGTWPEVWLSDDPVRAPVMVGDPCGICSLPRNGVGLRFDGRLEPFSGGQVPNCPNDASLRWILDSMVIVRDYQVEVKHYGTQPGQFQTEGCVVSASGPDGPPNHIEIQISQDQIEVWATDPGSQDLKAVARLTNAGLTLTRGYLTLEDAHFDAAQSPQPSTANHTYSWSNIGFDGPALPGVRTFEVADALTTMPDNTFSLGWSSDPATPINLSTPPISAVELASSTGALLVFNFGNAPVATLDYALNGVTGSVSSPFPPDSALWHSVALPVPLGSLVPGNQSVSVWGDQAIAVSNVSVMLVSASAPSDDHSVGCECSAPGTLSTTLLLLAYVGPFSPRRRRSWKLRELEVVSPSVSNSEPI